LVDNLKVDFLVRSFASRLIILLLAALSASPISKDESLSSASVRRWGSEIGMPEETLTAILATPDGYVWLASNHGLIRFDVSRAEVYHLGNAFRSTGTGSCSSNSLSALMLGDGGTIWVGSASGCIFRLIPDRFGSFANFQIQAYAPGDSSQESSGVLAIWPVPGKAEIRIVRRSQISSMKVEPVAGAGSLRTKDLKPRHSAESVVIRAPADKFILLAAMNSTERFYAVMTDRVLYSFDARSSAWRPLVTLQGTPRRMIAHPDGSVWIATRNGVMQWDGKSSRFFGKKDGMTDDDTSGVLLDRAGCLWFTHDSRVSRRCGERFETLPIGEQQEEKPTVIEEDSRGNVWLGGRWGNLYRIGSPLFRSYTKKDGLPESHLTGVATDSDGFVWASMRGEGLVRFEGGKVSQVLMDKALQDVQAIHPNPAGGILAASPQGIFEVNAIRIRLLPMASPIKFRSLPGLFSEATDKLLYSNVSASFRITRKMDKWVAEKLTGPARLRQWAKGANGSIYALSQYLGMFRLGQNGYVPAENVPASRARGWYSIAADHEGLLWVGTTEGLDLYSSQERRLLSSTPLLDTDHIFHIVEDRYGKIWCSTRDGLVRFSRAQALEAIRTGKNTLMVERYGEQQMLPTTNFGLVTSASGAADRQGRLWFPGLQGLVTIQPSDLERIPLPPKPLLLEMRSDGVSRDLNLEQRIPPGAERIELFFRTVRMDPLGGDFCRMRMIGFDPDWIACAPSRTAQYTNLAPGDYEFLLQTSSLVDTWNGPALQFPFRIEAHYHQLAWVRAGALLGLLALVLGFFWRREVLARRRTLELEQRVEERTRSLEQATLAAQAGSKAKMEFLATMSHEIRTPMNGVLGAVQLLAGSELGGDQQKLVSVIRQSGEDLIGIVDDILSLSKVEAGRLTLETTPTPVEPLCENLVNLFQPKAQANGIDLRYEIDANVPPSILTDPQRLRQILLNLVGNAIKFTERGQVQLRVTATQSPDRISFHVEDTGIGIAADRIPTLFDPFVQADSSTTRRFGGTGLGLAIVSRFVDAMRGSVEVDSELGHGSSFSVHLPLETPVESVAAPEPVAPRKEAPTGLTVLLAEDNAVNQMVFQRMLLRLGCEVLTVSNGSEAIALAQSRHVDLVLMDCQMPVLDGLSATRKLRALGGDFGKLPIIAITASAMAEDREQCMAAGMNDFLSKPLILAALEEKLAQWGHA